MTALRPNCPAWRKKVLKLKDIFANVKDILDLSTFKNKKLDEFEKVFDLYKKERSELCQETKAYYLAHFEEKGLDYIESKMKRIDISDPNNIILSMERDVILESSLKQLSGFDSERAWATREKIQKIKDSVKIDFDFYKAFFESLAGCDDERAWQIRNEFLFDKNTHDFNHHFTELILSSLLGMDSERAWDMREAIISHGTTVFQEIIKSIAGLNHPRAWDIRRDFLKDENNLKGEYNCGNMLKNLVGLDSEEAWEARKLLLKYNENLDYLLDGLVGVDSQKAWEIRESSYIVSKDNSLFRQSLLRSLAGIDSERAWEIRDSFYKGDWSDFQLNDSIRGLDSDRAWALRKKLFSIQGIEKKLVENSYFGAPQDFAWRKILDTHALKTSNVGF